MPLKLCLVYNPKDSKLHPDAYCSIFKDMFFALIDRFNCKCFVTNDCHANEIDADVIFFFDPHASHHVNIEGVAKHPAVKMEYWNDMHQKEMKGVYMTLNQTVHKLGQEQRVRRAEQRGTTYIVAGVKSFFIEQFSQYFGDAAKKMLLYFPHAPAMGEDMTEFPKRRQVVLGNGAVHGAFNHGYDFRKWAFEQPYIEHIAHAMHTPTTPKGVDYLKFLSGYAGALALCTPCPVPKYYEMPAAGCVTFAEYHEEYRELGFEHYETCIYVERDTIEKHIKDFLGNPAAYQDIADAGYNLMKTKYTAKHFANFIYNKAVEDKDGI